MRENLKGKPRPKEADFKEICDFQTAEAAWLLDNTDYGFPVAGKVDPVFERNRGRLSEE